ncbi:MAG: hypothetical protein RL735_700 [Pseudomonadota bacterium]
MVSPMSNMQEIHPDHVLHKVALIAAMIGCTTLVELVIVAAPILTHFMQPASLEARVLPQQLRNETMETEEQARQNALRELARTMQSKALAEEAARLKPRDFPADFAQTTTGAHFAARTETAIATTRNSAAMAAQMQNARLDPEDMQRLAGKAADAIRAGDIASARLVLEHAMRAGDATAIYALAETYDPRVLVRLRVQGMRGEPDKARELYRRALDSGIEEARARL